MRSTLPQLLSSLVTLISLLLVFPIPASAAALLAIDYGTDSFKASLVKPGVAFDVLVTREGRRKTPSLVTMRGEDRSFGGEAANMVSYGVDAMRCGTARFADGYHYPGAIR